MTEDDAWDELEAKQNKKNKQPDIDWKVVAAEQALTIALLKAKLQELSK